MEMLKSAVFTACLCAILTSAVQIFSPEKMKKEMRTVCALVTVICIAAKLTGTGMKVSLREFESDNFLSQSESADDFSTLVLSQTEENLRGNLESALAEKGIDAKKIIINCSLNEYNSVSADKAVVYLDNGATTEQIEAAKSALAAVLPDTEAEVKTVE